MKNYLSIAELQSYIIEANDIITVFRRSNGTIESNNPDFLSDAIDNGNNNYTFRENHYACTVKEESIIDGEVIILETYQKVIIKKIKEIDGLTGLKSQEVINRHIIDYFRGLEDRNPKPFAFIFIDLDHFKEINDPPGPGHEVGDSVLIETAEVLKESFRTTDQIFRAGGDEFAVLTTLIGDELIARVDMLKKNYKTKLAKINKLAAANMDVTLSVGICYVTLNSIYADENGQYDLSYGEILKSAAIKNIGYDNMAKDVKDKADIAMYYSRTNGARDGICVYEHGMKKPNDVGSRFK